MDSIWEKERPRLRFAPLESNKSTDIFIVGVGIAGVLRAYRVKRASGDCRLAKATKIYE